MKQHVHQVVILKRGQHSLNLRLSFTIANGFPLCLGPRSMHEKQQWLTCNTQHSCQPKSNDQNDVRLFVGGIWRGGAISACVTVL